MARIAFYPAPGVKVSDANALVTDVKDPKTFYSVAAPRKTGTMPTKAIVAANDLYEEGYHAGDPGGLDAIDVHLAPANIKKDVNIFGKVGTYEPSVATGSYTGNGAENRQITVGFQCKAVILFDTTDNLSWLCLTTTEAMKLQVGGDPTMDDDLLLHATNGFWVDESWANVSGSGYYYLAVG